MNRRDFLSGVVVGAGAVKFPIALMPEWAAEDVLANGRTLMEIYLEARDRRFVGVAELLRYGPNVHSAATRIEHITDEVVIVGYGVDDLGIHGQITPVTLQPGDTFDFDLRIETATTWDMRAFL